MISALIFAGGTGQRMNTRSKPKQFLEVHSKPVIIHTLEHFEYHPEIDNIIVVCIEDWIEEFQGMIKRFGISKIAKVIPGGKTGHESIYLGLEALKDTCKPDDIILIHDGVRPLINEELITLNIEAVKKYGNAITSEAARESVVRTTDGESITDVPPRSEMFTAKAPQSFRYGDILSLYEKAHEDGKGSIDSAHLCSIYNVPMHLVKSTKNNMKITEPADFYIYRALCEAIESQQIYGI